MRSRILFVLALGPLLWVLCGPAQAQSRRAPARPAPAAPTPHVHGTPTGWRFTWPTGDPARGREVFVKYECFTCHEVRGERFPAPLDAANVGPELSAMGPLHEAEYFAESIINPGAVIEPGKGYQAPDGSSKMPSYNDTITVQEVVDLVAYLRALRPPGAVPRGGPGAGGTGGHPTH
jgi:cbb3-type cytochrome oxidase cytochrome c subunit